MKALPDLITRRMLTNLIEGNRDVIVLRETETEGKSQLTIKNEKQADCSGIYFKFQKINRGTWKSGEVVEFKMDSLSFNPYSKYDVGLELIYSSLYPYKDIWLTISHNLTDSLFVNDTVKVNLVDGDGEKKRSKKKRIEI